MKGRAGFTLVETMLAIVIVGVLSVMAYPRVSLALVRNDLRAARTRVVNMISAARAAASQGGRSGSVLKFNGNTAVVTASPRRTVGGSGTEDTLGTVFNLYTTYGTTMSVSNGATQLAFDPRGIAANVSQQPVTVTLTRGGYSQQVVIDMLGRVTK